jgi:hypothetical protein
MSREIHVRVPALIEAVDQERALRPVPVRTPHSGPGFRHYVLDAGIGASTALGSLLGSVLIHAFGEQTG